METLKRKCTKRKRDQIIAEIDFEIARIRDEIELNNLELKDIETEHYQLPFPFFPPGVVPCPSNAAAPGQPILWDHRANYNQARAEHSLIDVYLWEKLAELIEEKSNFIL